MQQIRLYHSIMAANVSIWKRPRSKASHPPDPTPAMTSKTSQGRGLLSGTPLLRAIASSNFWRMTSFEPTSSPPPSMVKIFRGLLGFGKVAMFPEGLRIGVRGSICNIVEGF